jgi:acetyl-CoA carboxylase carboxyl transferase subunit beta
MQEGMTSLIQMPKVVVARLALAEENVACIVVLGDPTTGGVLASIGGLGDVTIAEAGATVGFAGPRVVEMVTGSVPSAASHSAVSALANGLIDEVVAKDDVHDHLAMVLRVLAPDEPEAVGTPPTPGTKPRGDGWAAVLKARSEDRPPPHALVEGICDETIRLRGDRSGRDDEAVVVAIGRMLGRRVLFIALDPTRGPGAGAYRLARRALRIAERLQVPVVTLVATPGADPSEGSEAGGVAWEIAQLFAAMAVTEVPIAAVVTGEGGSGGALAFAIGDVLLAYEDSIFSVIGPEGAATILWRDADRAPEAARALKLTAADLMSLGVADALLPEPPDAASLARVLAYHLDRLAGRSGHELVVARTGRWRQADGDG